MRAQREVPAHPCLSLQVDQSGLGLPSRDYYLNKTENEKVSRSLRREWLPPPAHCSLWFVSLRVPSVFSPVQVFEARGTQRCHLLIGDMQSLAGEGCHLSSF